MPFQAGDFGYLPLETKDISYGTSKLPPRARDHPALILQISRDEKYALVLILTAFDIRPGDARVPLQTKFGSHRGNSQFLINMHLPIAPCSDTNRDKPKLQLVKNVHRRRGLNRPGYIKIEECYRVPMKIIQPLKGSPEKLTPSSHRIIVWIMSQVVGLNSEFWPFQTDTSEPLEMTSGLQERKNEEEHRADLGKSNLFRNLSACFNTVFGGTDGFDSIELAGSEITSRDQEKSTLHIAARSTATQQNQIAPVKEAEPKATVASDVPIATPLPTTKPVPMTTKQAIIASPIPTPGTDLLETNSKDNFKTLQEPVAGALSRPVTNSNFPPTSCSADMPTTTSTMQDGSTAKLAPKPSVELASVSKVEPTGSSNKVLPSGPATTSQPTTTSAAPKVATKSPVDSDAKKLEREIAVLRQLNKEIQSRLSLSEQEVEKKKAELAVSTSKIEATKHFLHIISQGAHEDASSSIGHLTTLLQ